MLGLDHVSVRSLTRWAEDVRRFGIAGIISGNWLGATGQHFASRESVLLALLDRVVGEARANRGDALLQLSGGRGAGLARCDRCFL
jgi:hypothetical protein